MGQGLRGRRRPLRLLFSMIRPLLLLSSTIRGDVGVASSSSGRCASSSHMLGRAIGAPRSVEAVLRHPMLFFASSRAPKAGNRLPASKFSASTSRAACILAKPDSQPCSPSSPRRFNSAAAPSSSGARARAQARPRPTSLCRSVRRPRCRDPSLPCPASLCSRAAWVDAVSAPKPLTPRQGTTISSHACAPVLQPSPPHAAGTLAPRGRIQPVPGRRKPPHCPCAPASSLSRSRPPRVFPPRPSR
ncbi:uncharacterized protein [Triticum aestivum]|uniref:uncharacterized protein isoform X1 n=1 Tax=Triticum aestivum TaxID=4565 RepID=UPI001D0275D6|nr:uncharacterized protein LOC123091488 isoform X1 [Triticum aestivum]